ncbi:hypothetical protein VC623_02765 [Citrobacter amalonaticus]|uniref:hypothetical protein n=1 Tax=Citrobacter amalonaticus TaxID=35703 RepID=UPI00190873EE|nr:hypothetical protein [Citrobacter amalonaticus]EKV7298790.1 hypothetical protein [Citrobacter farmeri]EKW3840923.1 hypothetical protein [Citrobacter amalonaticus]MBJ9325792.1 hypothetical protein [Citrobacter amalonaticus]MDV0783565.1 hypothetical protein [Citrobacter amalonaticus]MEB0639628.1 hypothetical protein [Citrobacter amalonaticus]
MATFAVIVDNPNENLNTRVLRLFGGDDCFKVNDRMWFVNSVAATPKDVFLQLAVNPDTGQIDEANVFGRVLITASNAYWGYHNTELWPWLSAKGGG